MNAKAWTFALFSGACWSVFPSQAAPVQALTSPQKVPNSVSPVVAKALGPPALRVIKGATEAETFRLGKPLSSRAKDPGMDRFAVATVGPQRGTAFVGSLQNILLDPRMYPNNQDRCLFDPGYAFRLRAGRGSLDLILCFHCDDALIVTHDAAGQETSRLFTNFGALRPRLMAVIRQAFPADVLPYRRKPVRRK